MNQGENKRCPDERGLCGYETCRENGCNCYEDGFHGLDCPMRLTPLAAMGGARERAITAAIFLVIAAVSVYIWYVCMKDVMDALTVR